MVRKHHKVHRSIVRSEPRTGIKTLDRGLLTLVWMMAVLYGLMCEEMVSKTPAESCEVRQALDNIYGLVSLTFVLIIPAGIGPLAASIIYTLITLSKREDHQVTERENIKCTASVTIIFLALYINTMILCELWDFTKENMFALVLGIAAVTL